MTHVNESMKWGKSKQLSDYISHAVLPWHQFRLYWLVLQNRASVAMQVSKYVGWGKGRNGGGGAGGGHMAEFGTSSGPYTIIWVGKAEGTTWCFLTSSSFCLHHNTVLLWTHTHQSDNIRCKAPWLHGLKYHLVLPNNNKL